MIAEAIKKINPNANFHCIQDDINSIQWCDDTTPIPIADIQAQFVAVELDMAIKELRNKRNKLLAETDYLALSDVTMSNDWKTYRQELRDITNGLDTVEKVQAVEFPTKPSGE